MRGYATDEEIEQYRRDGFAVPRDVLDPPEVAAPHPVRAESRYFYLVRCT